jgi:hypothetical protein
MRASSGGELAVAPCAWSGPASAKAPNVMEIAALLIVALRIAMFPL